MSGGVAKKINKMMQSLCEQGSTLSNNFFVLFSLFLAHVHYLLFNQIPTSDDPM